MIQYPKTFDYKIMNEMRDILIEIGLPRKLYNPRCIMTMLALADLSPDSQWKSTSEQYKTVHQIIQYINANFPNKAGLDDRGYQENSREMFRDETVSVFTNAGLTEGKPGLSPNSKDNAYRLTAVFAALLRCYGTERWTDELTAFNESHESYADKLKQVKQLEKGIPIDYAGLHLDLHRDPHNKLQAQILSDFVSYFASGAELIYVGDAKNRRLYAKSERMKELGIRVYSDSNKMPDITLYDKARKRLIFVEAYYSSGEFTLERVNEVKSMCGCDENLDIVFITAFPSAAKMKRAFDTIAWDTEIWLADNPTHMIHKNGDKFIGNHGS